LANDIYFYRLSSDIFPWASEYEMEDLPDYEMIAYRCKRIGEFAKQHGMRLTAHPGHFNKLASPKERVYKLTETDLSVHAKNVRHDWFASHTLCQVKYPCWCGLRRQSICS
jgi:UV DNA damage endonuclease